MRFKNTMPTHYREHYSLVEILYCIMGKRKEKMIRKERPWIADGIHRSLPVDAKWPATSCSCSLALLFLLLHLPRVCCVFWNCTSEYTLCVLDRFLVCIVSQEQKTTPILQPAEVKEFLCVLNTSLTLHCSASKRATEMATLSELVSEAKSGKEWKLKTRTAFTGRRTRLLCDYVNVQHRIIFPQLA